MALDQQRVQSFMEESSRDRAGLHQQIDAQGAAIRDIKAQVDRMAVGMFAADADNEFGTPGLMTTMRNVDKHLTVTCNLARWVRRFVVGTLGIAVPVAALGRHLGWW